MGKKNTLLYLDEELVDRAKQMDINLSQVTEDALKERILPFLSTGEKPLVALDQVIDEYVERGMAYRLPFRIDSITLDSIGPIDHLDTVFDDVTALTGGNGSGKSTVLKAIAHSYGQGDINTSMLLDHSAEQGAINMEITPEEQLELTLDRQDSTVSTTRSARCLLIDGLFGRLTDERTTDLLDQIVERDEQIIFTGYRDELFQEHDGVTVVDLDG